MAEFLNIEHRLSNESLKKMHGIPKILLEYFRVTDDSTYTKLELKDANLISFSLIPYSAIGDVNKYPFRKLSTFLALTKCTESLNYFMATSGSSTRLSRDKKFIKLFSENFIFLKGQYKYNKAEQGYISEIIAEYLLSVIESSPQESFTDRVSSLTCLVHILSNELQFQTIEKFNSLVAQCSGKCSDFLVNTIHLVECLNISKSLLSLITNSIDSISTKFSEGESIDSDNSIESKSKVAGVSEITEGLPLAEPELDSDGDPNALISSELDAIKKFIINNKSLSQARGKLADYRRLSAKSMQSDRHRAWAYSTAIKLSEEIITESNIDTVKTQFCHLCLLCQIFLNRKEALQIYSKIFYFLRNNGEGFYFTFLSSSGLNEILASSTYKGVEVFLINPSNNYNSLEDYYHDLLLKRTKLQNLSLQQTLSDAVCVMATTDDIRKLSLIEMSILSVLIQTKPPKEIIVFIDPVHQIDSDIQILISRLCIAELRQNYPWAFVGVYKEISIKVVANKNVKGQYYARNRAAAISTSKYFFNQDDDDLSSEIRFEKQINTLKSGSLINYGLHIRISEDNSILQDSRDLEFFGDGIATLATTTELVRKNPFLELRSRADVEFRDRIKKRYGSSSISNIDQVLLLMRGSNSSVSSQFEHENAYRLKYFYQNISDNFFSF